jgi:hypothetical protein
MKNIALYGPELTFGSDDLIKSFRDLNDPTKLETSFSNELIEFLALYHIESFATRDDKNEIPVFSRPERYWKGMKRNVVRLTYPDGWYLEYFSDPGVIEVNSSPMTYETALSNCSRMQRDIFDAMNFIGQAPQLFAGAGHIHVDIKAFEGSYLNFRNFIIDFFNHSSLTNGALNDDKYNSIGVADLPVENRDVLILILKEYDSLKFSDEILRIKSLAKSITDYVYTIAEGRDPIYPFQDHKTRPVKYHAINLKNVYESALSSGGNTIEIRCLRPQESALALVQTINLFEERIEFLKKFTTPIDFTNPRAFDLSMTNEQWEMPLELERLSREAQAVLTEFHCYLTETGLNWADYKKLVLPWWHGEGGEIEKFENGQIHLNNLTL